MVARIEALSRWRRCTTRPTSRASRSPARAFPDLPQVAVFDTAFHQTLPPRAYTYAVPREWRERHSVRRYGFHGTSHAYVSRAAARLAGPRRSRTCNVIVLHLGNGASAARGRRRPQPSTPRWA